MAVVALAEVALAEEVFSGKVLVKDTPSRHPNVKLKPSNGVIMGVIMINLCSVSMRDPCSL